MNKKEEIIKAAKELFSVYGYKKVTMDEIAKESGVTKKTVYTYIKDKDELLKCILFIELENMRVIMDKIDKEEIPYENKIHKIIYAMVEYKKKNKLLSVIAKESENLPVGTTKECIKILDDTILNAIKEKIDAFISKGVIKDCNSEFVAFIIYKIYVAVMFEWNKPINEKKVAKELMNILKTGLFN